MLKSANADGDQTPEPPLVFKSRMAMTALMNLTAPDIVGFVGVSLIVATYFLSQLGRMDVGRPLYPALNGVGALLILFSLYFTFNAASVVVEGFWLAISAVGLIRSIMKRSRKAGEE